MVKAPKHQKIIIFGGPPASGKTAVLSQLILHLKHQGQQPGVCKIDCLKTDDDRIFKALEVPSVVGLALDLCPDHFLAVNLAEICDWGKRQELDVLLIETAGLCHRCAPATTKTIAVCVLDCLQGFRVPQKIGPVLTACDLAVLTKTDLVSQAEAEVFYQSVRQLNATCQIIEVNGVTGTGIDYLSEMINSLNCADNVDGDMLRHEMPSSICSYCVGERRIGNQYQQGIVRKMEFPK
jgi:Ni2+-binding GTPase involved in maturation of urease and hydrogenase